MNVFSLWGRIALESEQYRQSLRDVEQKTAQTSQGMETKWGRSLRNMEQRLDRAGQNMQRIGGMLSKRVTAPLLAVGGAAVAAATKLGNTADELLDLEQQTGLTTGTLQEFRRVSREAGVGQDVLASSAEGMARRLRAAGDESKTFQENIRALGIETREADGSLRSMDDLMPEIISELQGMDDITTRNSIAMQIFGRRATELAPILGMTAEETNRLRQEARDMGEVMERESLVQANEFRIAVADLGADLQVVGRDLVLEMLPALKEFAGFLRQSVVPGVRSVAERIAALIGWFNDLGPGAQRAVTIAVAALGAAGPFVMAVGVATRAVSGLIGVIRTLRTVMLFMGPGGFVVGAAAIVGGLAAAFFGNRNSLENATKKAAESTREVRDEIDGLAEAASTATEGTEEFTEANDALHGKLTDLGDDLTGDARQAWKDYVDEMVETSEKARELGVSIGDADEDGSLREAVDSLSGELTGDAKDAFEEYWKQAQKADGEIATVATGIVQSWARIANASEAGRIQAELALAQEDLRLAEAALDAAGTEGQVNAQEELNRVLDRQNEIRAEQQRLREGGQAPAGELERLNREMMELETRRRNLSAMAREGRHAPTEDLEADVARAEARVTKLEERLDSLNATIEVTTEPPPGSDGDGDDDTDKFGIPEDDSERDVTVKAETVSDAESMDELFDTLEKLGTESMQKMHRAGGGVEAQIIDLEGRADLLREAIGAAFDMEDLTAAQWKYLQDRLKEVEGRLNRLREGVDLEIVPTVRVAGGRAAIPEPGVQATGRVPHRTDTTPTRARGARLGSTGFQNFGPALDTLEDDLRSVATQTDVLSTQMQQLNQDSKDAVAILQAREEQGEVLQKSLLYTYGAAERLTTNVEIVGQAMDDFDGEIQRMLGRIDQHREATEEAGDTAEAAKQVERDIQRLNSSVEEYQQRVRDVSNTLSKEAAAIASVRSDWGEGFGKATLWDQNAQARLNRAEEAFRQVTESIDTEAQRLLSRIPQHTAAAAEASNENLMRSGQELEEFARRGREAANAQQEHRRRVQASTEALDRLISSHDAAHDRTFEADAATMRYGQGLEDLARTSRRASQAERERRDRIEQTAAANRKTIRDHVTNERFGSQASQEAATRQALIQSLKRFGSLTEDQQRLLDELNAKLKNTVGGLSEWIEALRATDDAGNQVVAKLLELAGQVPVLGAALDGLEVEIDKAGKAIVTGFDPVSALIGVFSELLGKSEGFASLMETLGLVLQPVINVLDSFFGAINRVVKWIFGIEDPEKEDTRAPKGSILELERRIAAHRRGLEEATTDEERGVWARNLAKLEEQLEKMREAAAPDVGSPEGSISDMQEKLAEFQRVRDEATNPAFVAAMNQHIEDLQKKINEALESGVSEEGDEPPPGSIAAMQEEMSRLREERDLATGAERADLNQQIAELQDRIADAIEAGLDDAGDKISGMIAEKEAERAELIERRDEATTEEEIENFNKQIAVLEEELKRLRELGLGGEAERRRQETQFGDVPQSAQLGVATPIVEGAVLLHDAGKLFKDAISHLVGGEAFEGFDFKGLEVPIQEFGGYVREFGEIVGLLTDPGIRVYTAERPSGKHLKERLITPMQHLRNP